MTKLRDLINESKFLKREFGDPLPTFEDVMEKHQVNKLEEGWWENMSDAAQKAYIKKHGAAPGSAGGDDKGDEDDYDMGVVPGSREEWEDIEPGDPEMRSGDESQEELGNMIKQQQNYIEDLYEKGADREDIEAAEGNREDMEREMEEKEDAEEKRGSEYSEDDPPPENQGDPDWEEFNLDAWGDKLDRAADDDRISGEDYKELEGTLEKIEDAYASGDTETAEKLSAEYRRKTSGKFPWRGEESPGRTGNELNQETLMIDGKQFRRISEMTSKTKRDMENSFDSAEDLDDFITKHQSGIPKNQWRKMDNYLDDIRDEEEGMKPSGWADPAKKGLKKILTRYIKESAKPNNRISEGVEKQPKPKYAFSEFYQRLKR